MATTHVTVPDIGGATEVDVIEVLVKVGDVIETGSPLVILESDKSTMDLPSSAAGTVKEIKVKAGDKVSEGTTIVVLNLSETHPQPPPRPPAQQQQVAPEKKNALSIPEEGPPPQHTSLAETHAGPAVRKLARELGVDLAQVDSTGPKERIVIEDLQNYVKTRLSQGASSALNSALPAAPLVDFTKFGEVEAQPLSRIKKLTGKNLHRNWLLVPLVTQFIEADITLLEEFRSANKAAFAKQNLKLTPLVFIMKAVAVALKKFPTFNASLDASGDNLILKKYFHIGVAVDTPEGLVVPVVRDVDKKSVSDLAKELSVISEKARNKQLVPTEMQGGCFSISSLGGIGGTAFTPIVNLPEVAILGVSKASYKPIYDKGQFVPRLMLPLSLSYDHRVIDGADGARFSAYLAYLLEDIRNLLI